MSVLRKYPQETQVKDCKDRKKLRHRETETINPRYCDSKAFFHRTKSHDIKFPAEFRPLCPLIINFGACSIFIRLHFYQFMIVMLIRKKRKSKIYAANQYIYIYIYIYIYKLKKQSCNRKSLSLFYLCFFNVAIEEKLR